MSRLLTDNLKDRVHGFRPQGVTLSYKNTSLEDVLKDIQQQTGYHFLYISEQLEQANKVTIAIKDATLEEVLEYCFREQPLGFEIKDKTVIIRPKPRLTTSLQQDATPRALIEVRGVITDAHGQPLVGANVKIKGTNIGTITNGDGSFVLKNVNENAELIISYVGFEAKAIRVKNINNIKNSILLFFF